MKRKIINSFLHLLTPYGNEFCTMQLKATIEKKRKGNFTKFQLFLFLHFHCSLKKKKQNP